MGKIVFVLLQLKNLMGKNGMNQKKLFYLLPFPLIFFENNYFILYIKLVPKGSKYANIIDLLSLESRQ